MLVSQKPSHSLLNRFNRKYVLCLVYCVNCLIFELLLCTGGVNVMQRLWKIYTTLFDGASLYQLGNSRATQNNKNSTSEVCIACPGWLCWSPTLISLSRSACAGCGRSTLEFIERFWLGSVRSPSIAMNTAMNCTCKTMHKNTEMYSESDIQNFDNLKPAAWDADTRTEMPIAKPQLRHMSVAWWRALATKPCVQIMSDCSAWRWI